MNLREAFDYMLKTMYESKPQPPQVELMSPAEYARRAARRKKRGVPMWMPSALPWKGRK
jgi:hypothetical protein